MNRKNYKRKVAEIFSFKSPKAEKLKQITHTDNLPTKPMEEDNKATTMATVQQKTDIAQFGKKRDVIVIGAGLSGKY